MQRNDSELVAAAVRGDASAFHELVDRYTPHLFRVASMLSRNAADAEDIVQETFAGAFAGLARFDGRSSLKTWLSRICSRQAARVWHKSRGSRRSTSLEETAELGISDSGLSVGSTTAVVDQKIDVAAVLQTLSAEHREVLTLREMQGLSYAEIAEELNVPQGTVESRIHRARAEVRRRLEGYES